MKFGVIILYLDDVVMVIVFILLYLDIVNDYGYWFAHDWNNDYIVMCHSYNNHLQ